MISAMRSTTLACVLLGAATTTVSALVLVAGIAPQSDIAATVDGSRAYEARARRQIADDPTPENLAQAERDTRASLEMSVANPTAWLRLAYIERTRAEAFNSNAALAVSRSYDLAPYGPDDTPWRLVFLFDDWSTIGPELRSAALEELRVTPRALIRQLPDRISDPSGRIAVVLASGRFGRPGPRR